jgi:succinate-semialdehyde dehydrogenase / glutarate-semialdehyde dehydrogenase
MKNNSAIASSRNGCYRPDELTKGLYINGLWQVASSGKTLDVVDPSNESLIARVADADEIDGLATVEAAAAAAPEWADTAPRKRAEILRRCFELMTERAKDLAWLISLENGKALSDARGEVGYAAEFFRWNA